MHALFYSNKYLPNLADSARTPNEFLVVVSAKDWVVVVPQMG